MVSGFEDLGEPWNVPHLKNKTPPPPQTLGEAKKQTHQGS